MQALHVCMHIEGQSWRQAGCKLPLLFGIRVNEAEQRLHNQSTAYAAMEHEQDESRRRAKEKFHEPVD